MAGCYDEQPATEVKKNTPFVFKETIVQAPDTGMTRLGSFKRNNIADILCQHWTLDHEPERENEAMGFDPLKNFPEDMILFKDSFVVLNPFDTIMVGRWRTDVHDNQRRLSIYVKGRLDQEYSLERLTSNQLIVERPGAEKSYLYFISSGILHKHSHSDPFHPVNNFWRIMPSSPELEPAIKARVKNCIRFFALYFRDHLKRNAETISFRGLPLIFTWYNRGIGLPDKNDLSDEWIACFYDKEQASEGYRLLRRLIVDYEYDWPKRAPNWMYATHSVLEQMYHRIDSLN